MRTRGTFVWKCYRRLDAPRDRKYARLFLDGTKLKASEKHDLLGGVVLLDPTSLLLYRGNVIQTILRGKIHISCSSYLLDNWTWT
jgi:hypothetical protein